MFPLQTAVPSRYPPIATWALIAANCAVFLVEVNLSPEQLDAFIAQFALVPADVLMPLPGSHSGPGPAAWLPIVTNMFLHGGWLHLIFNMWTLWLFGPAIEDRMGSGRYLAFYLGCGVLASVSHAVFNPTSMVPALGASGAIAGVLGCYVRLFPLARMIVLVPVLFLPLFFELPAIIFVGLWFLLQLMQGAAEFFMPSGGGGIAWWAHVGGFLAGLAIGPLLHRPIGRYRKHYADEGILGFTPLGRR
ncbi:MAG TPA: rhomboid family intramembrane serine protease [Alphaproteobacteria bacterium]|nr:rhomboid family intramembrane serine protease [Alphaproteobacteria bacterium]